jgi:hypothetical protein
MNGWVKAESIEGEGSTFKLSIEVKFLIDDQEEEQIMLGQSNFEHDDDDCAYLIHET